MQLPSERGGRRQGVESEPRRTSRRAADGGGAEGRGKQGGVCACEPKAGGGRGRVRCAEGRAAGTEGPVSRTDGLRARGRGDG